MPAVGLRQSPHQLVCFGVAQLGCFGSESFRRNSINPSLFITISPVHNVQSAVRTIDQLLWAKRSIHRSKKFAGPLFWNGPRSDFEPVFTQNDMMNQVELGIGNENVFEIIRRKASPSIYHATTRRSRPGPDQNVGSARRG